MIIIEAGASQTKVGQIRNETIGKVQYFDGISPTYMSQDKIVAILKSVFQNIETDTSLHYYGTGCVARSAQEKVRACIMATSNIQEVHIDSDLLGAARAVAVDKSGQVNILGTGSASCLYNGIEIEEIYLNTGYLFGDYGSGFHIGKSLLKAYFQNQLSDEVNASIEAFSGLEKRELIQKIYKDPASKSTIAQFAKCASSLKSNPNIKSIIQDSFKSFVKHQIKLNSNYLDTPQNFVGSIAYYFKDELNEILENENIVLSKVCASPIKDLMRYHLTYRQ